MVFLPYIVNTNGSITSDSLWGANVFEIGRDNVEKIKFREGDIRFFSDDVRVYNLNGETSNPIPFFRVFGRIRSNFALIISDDRYKHNEVDISNALSTIRKLNPKTYDKTQIELDKDFSGDLSGIEHYKENGVIAQDLLKIDELKHSVNIPDEENEVYSVNYNNLLIYALSAIKELDAKIISLENALDNNNIL